MNNLLNGLRGLGAARLAMLAAIGAATLGLFAWLSLSLSASAPMVPLYTDLDLRDAGAMADLLDKAHLAHSVDAEGSTILVQRDQLAQARLALARGNLPGGGAVGYEIFDRGDNLTASQFQQDINQTRALEGELARSIRMIRGVRAVRVHLVMARHDPFADQQQDAQASVLLTMAGSARLDRGAVQAILNLVASGVPQLKPANIALVDDRGSLLARAGQPAEDGADATADDLQRAAGIRIAHDVEQLLERSLGPGHVRAEANVAMDFDQTRETAEKYDPDGQVARSTQTVTDSSRNTEKDAAVTVANNLPNPGADTTGTGSQTQRQEETSNYEIGKTTLTTVHDAPRIRRITLAVMVDGTMVTQNGKPVWQERGADELARIATLARGAIGYDEKRGDKVDIVSMRFTEDDAGTTATSLPLGLGHDDAMRIGQYALLALLTLLLVVAVLRPAVLRLSAAAMPTLPPPQPDALASLPGAPPNAGLLTDDTMIGLNHVEGQIRSSTVRRIAELVDRHPEESLAIMRGWIAQES